MIGKAPTAQQKRWHDWLAKQGCALGLGEPELHHAVGRSGKFNKLHIGQWWVNPLSYEAHRGDHGIHRSREIFAGHGLGETRKEIEKTILRRHVADYLRKFGELPMPADVIRAIEEYRR